MRLVYISDRITEHIIHTCKEFYNLLGEGFVFIETFAEKEDMRKIFINQGFAYYHSANIKTENYCWIKYYYDDIDYNNNLINEADVVLVGNCSDRFIAERIKKRKLVVKAHERWYKNGLNLFSRIRGIIGARIHHGKRNLYLFCASAYTAIDAKKVFAYNKRKYVWGYFPELKKYDIDKLLLEKDKTKLVWCGRFIENKHPDDALWVARLLKHEGYEFSLDMIGAGDMEESLKSMVADFGLMDNVTFLGMMNPTQVRSYMEKAGIFLFTSDKHEGWGVALNEAMNSACAVVASHAIGAVPYLMNKDNGITYKSGDIEQLCKGVKVLLDKPGKQNEYGREAYNTILDMWNPQIAAERFVETMQCIINGEFAPRIYESGPCSIARIINDNWIGDRYFG